jgi:hypothetical protein
LSTWDCGYMVAIRNMMRALTRSNYVYLMLSTFFSRCALRPSEVYYHRETPRAHSWTTSHEAIPVAC